VKIFTKVVKLLVIFKLPVLLVGCAAVQSALDCPDDPFDPSASGACRWTYSKDQQEGRLDRESDKTAVLDERVKSAEAEAAASEKTAKAIDEEAAELRAELRIEERKVKAAESRLAALRSTGEKSDAELNALESDLSDLSRKIAEARAGVGDSAGEIERMKKLKDELAAELDSLLDEL